MGARLNVHPLLSNAQVDGRRCLPVLPEKGQSAPPFQGQPEVQEQKCGLCPPTVLQKPLCCPSCKGFWEMLSSSFPVFAVLLRSTWKEMKKASRQQLGKSQSPPIHMSKLSMTPGT